MADILKREQLVAPRALTRASAALAAQPQRLALGVILALSAGLETFRLSRIGYGNMYYAATVRSMLTSWHNFIFASYDPGGFVSVDKPPLGFWLQAASAKLFGFSGVSLLLPEALATVLSVGLLYVLVRRSWGVWAGLIAALALALTPITVVTGRNNTIDSLLVLALLAATWAMLQANRTGYLRWLLASMVLVGIGFNIKMLEAYLALPALGALYLVGTRTRSWQLIRHGLLATAVLLVVSLSWVTAVDLTPASERPYVGSSDSNSALELALGYNGVQRLLGRIGPGGRAPAGAANGPRGGGGGVGGASENGSSGVLRLLDDELGPQVSWLLPLTLLGLAAGAWQTCVWRRLPLSRPQQALVLWGVWFATGATFFSIAGFFHRYYLVTLAPSIAALAGIGVVALWRDYQRRRWRGGLLPIVLVATAATQLFLLRDFGDWQARLAPVVVGGCLVAVVGLAALKLPRWRQPRRATPALVVALAALLVGPAIWGGYSVRAAANGTLPAAGPTQPGNGFAGGPRGGGSVGGLPGGFGERGQQVDAQLLAYLQVNRGSAKFLLAVPSSMSASDIIIATGEPVMALGGFSGADPILTTDALAKLVADGTVRFFELDGFGGGRAFNGGATGTPGDSGFSEFRDQGPPNDGFGGDATRPEFGYGAFPDGGFPGGAGQQTSVLAWVEQNCQAVPPSAYGASGNGGALYDCAAATGS